MRPDLEQLEATVAAEPEDLATRAKLLSAYAQAPRRDPVAADRRAAPVLWLIEHHPSEELLSSPVCVVVPTEAAYARVCAAWDRALADPSVPPMAFLHAAHAVVRFDAPRARALLERGEQAEPGWFLWARTLATVAKMSGDLEGALAHLERALAKSDARMRPVLGYECAATAIACGRLDAALLHADAVIADGGNAHRVYLAHCIRGLAFVGRGEVAAAKREREIALGVVAHQPPPPGLDSPDRALADALEKHGA